MRAADTDRFISADTSGMSVCTRDTYMNQFLFTLPVQKEAATQAQGMQNSSPKSKD